MDKSGNWMFDVHEKVSAAKRQEGLAKYFRSMGRVPSPKIGRMENDQPLPLSAVRTSSSQHDSRITLIVDLLTEEEQQQIGNPAAGETLQARMHNLGDEEEDEDGVHGGRMKPLASFDVNRPMKYRRVKMKMSSKGTADPIMVAGSPHISRRGQDKENVGSPQITRRGQDKENANLAPFFAPVTSKGGMKRKIASPKETALQNCRTNRIPENTPWQCGTATASSLSEDEMGVDEGPKLVEEREANSRDVELMVEKNSDSICQRTSTKSPGAASVSARQLPADHQLISAEVATDAECVSPQQSDFPRKRQVRDQMLAFCPATCSLVQTGKCTSPVGMVSTKYLASTEKKMDSSEEFFIPAYSKGFGTRELHSNVDKIPVEIEELERVQLVKFSDQKKNLGTSSMTGGGKDKYAHSRSFGHQRTQFKHLDLSNRPSSSRLRVKAIPTRSCEMVGVLVDQSPARFSDEPGPAVPLDSSSTPLPESDTLIEVPITIASTSKSYLHPSLHSSSHLATRGIGPFGSSGGLHYTSSYPVVRRSGAPGAHSGSQIQYTIDELVPKIAQRWSSSIPSCPKEVRLPGQEGNDLIHFSGSGRGSARATTASGSDTVAYEKRTRQKRGHSMGKQERLSTKVLNKSVENWVQLMDPTGGLNQRVLSRVQISELSPACGSFGPQPRHFSFKVPNIPAPNVKRSQKKASKEKVVNAKPANFTSKYKSLEEPSGFLGAFNPGIMQRVRERKSIQAILGAFIGASATSLGETELSQTKERVRNSDGFARGAENEDDLVIPLSLSLDEEKHSPSAATECGLVAAGCAAENGEGLDEGIDAFPYSEPETDANRETESTLEATQVEDLSQTRSFPDSNSVDATAMNPDLLHSQQQSNELRDYEPGTHGYCDGDGSPSAGRDNNEGTQPMSTGAPSAAVLSSPEAAGVAARWLDLISLDIKGRLSALKRSRRRVRNEILSEKNLLGSGFESSFPCKISTADKQDSHLHSSPDIPSEVIGGVKPVWLGLFTSMDNVLCMEGSQLESKLCLVKQMRDIAQIKPTVPAADKSDLECTRHSIEVENQRAPRYPFSPLQMEDIGSNSAQWPLKMEAIQKEWAVAASAASILLTANFIENENSTRIT